MTKLCIVPTPIGNLEDMTLRGLRMLKECDLILAEDTRVTKKLLSHFEITKFVLPFHAHNEHRSLSAMIERIMTNQLTVLVSDAGTPGISDPGFLLARECVNQGIDVECLPGPTAFVPALVASGFPCDRFVFEGFLPHKKGRQSKLTRLGKEERTVIIYESPHRLVKCLEQICEFISPERNVCVVRELSKLYEEFRRGTAKDVLSYYTSHSPKGEIVIIIEGSHEKN
jgi:16S rRNA (cytidine1402-2'-O)-methyltransferase